MARVQDRAEAWLDLRRAEVRHKRHDTGNDTLTRCDYWHRRVDRCRRRYVECLKALTHVRKLNLTVIGRNVQVNV